MVGVDPGAFEATDTQSAPNRPGPPVETAGGERPTAVMAKRWNGCSSLASPRAAAPAASRGEPRGAAAIGDGTQTDRGNRIGSFCRWIWATRVR